MGWSSCHRLPWSYLPSPVRRDAAPECEAGAPPDIPVGCAVVLLRRTHHPPDRKAGRHHDRLPRRRPTADSRSVWPGPARCDKKEPMSDFQAIADRVEIEALRGEFTDAAMMSDYDRVASLFTPDGDTASGRAYLQEIIRLRDSSSHLNYAIYHDRYRRTGNGW